MPNQPPPQEPNLAEASRFWLQLGLISFGGPAGQIALLHRELVEQRRWLSERRFLHALNYCMLLPGPEAMQLATYLGWLLHGVAGGLIAGGLFVLPSVLVLTALSTTYALWGHVPLLTAVFATLKPAVLALVAMAAWRLGRRVLKTPLQAGLAGAGFVALALLRLPYPLVVATAALVGWAAGRWRPTWIAAPAAHGAVAASDTDGAALHGDATPTPTHARFSRRGLALTLLIWALALLIPLGALAAWGGWDGPLALMGRFFTRVALLSFGGAYAVLPYVAQGAVEHFGWLSASQMLDGLALGETTPGPLIMVVAFVGFMGGWQSQLLGGPGSWLAAVAALLVAVWFTFLPSFGFILAGGPLVERSRGDLRIAAPLTAISSAVVGVIASLAVFFAGPVLLAGGQLQPLNLAVLLASLVALLRWRWRVLQLIGAAVLLGVVRQLLGW